MLNKKTLGVKKVQGQSEVQKRRPSDKASHTCENMLYTID